MAGHSKWANIKHRKGREDARRGRLFTKLIREITVAAKLGGADAQSNPRLRAAIDNALSNNMTKDTIDRAVKRGAGGDEGGQMDEIRYEGYGPGGVALMVDTITDNKNRTVAELRHVFSKFGGNLGTDGSVSYLFSKAGLLSYPASAACLREMDEEALMEAALAAGAEDISSNEDGAVEVITAADRLKEVEAALTAAGLAPARAEISITAENSIPLGREQAAGLLKLLDRLEELDDVQRVHANAEIADEVLAQLA